MRALLFLFCFYAATSGFGQATLQHYGGMQFHEGAQVGLYGSFINQAPFQQEAGLFGFYGNKEIRVSGDFALGLAEVEIFRGASVFLDQSVGVADNLSFIDGDFQTNKALPEIYITLLQNAITVGESDVSKVNGYVTVINQARMVFPVGDASEYRPLILEGDVFPIAKCAYFRENPNSPSTFSPFRTDLKPRTIEFISTAEFWRLQGSSTGQITLSWNPNSNLGGIASTVSEITIMGWSKTTERWEALGTQTVTGDLDNGFAISAPFVPDSYEILTFGSLAVPEELLTLENYYLSPNGDGINDFLVIDALEGVANNRVEIFDRNGLRVFVQENYSSEFGGVSNVDGLVINPQKGLPEGVYYFVVTLPEPALQLQGYFFLDR